MKSPIELSEIREPVSRATPEKGGSVPEEGVAALNAEVDTIFSGRSSDPNGTRRLGGDFLDTKLKR